MHSRLDLHKHKFLPHERPDIGVPLRIDLKHPRTKPNEDMSKQRLHSVTELPIPNLGSQTFQQWFYRKLQITCAQASVPPKA